MIFDLVQDFAAVLDAMPAEHMRRSILKLLDEALRRDVHFIDRHPTTLFQCLWNSCWWYDCPEAAEHYADSGEDPRAESLLTGSSDAKLSALLEVWRAAKVNAVPGSCGL